MKEKSKDMGKKKKILREGSVVAIFMAILILAVAFRNYFSFLEKQLFEERRSHIVEFTDKAAEIVDSVIEYSWQQVYACEHVMKTRKINSEEKLLEALVSTADFIDSQNSLVLAIDQSANYYASDAAKGRFSQTEFLTEESGDSQQIVTEIPHKNGNTYFVCMERLKEPIMFTAGKKITHLAVAVDIDVMRDRSAVKGYGDLCYTYLVNDDGRRLYKYTYANNFIEGYNILNALENVDIRNGGTYQGFVRELEKGESPALEFTFIDPDGKKRNWFVAGSAITSKNWHILLFVPTEVLGANSNLLLKNTIRFFGIVSVVFLALAAVIIVITTLSRADKRLVRQKDEANQLLKTAVEEANSANQAKSDFLSHMSHDIRTPINGIMGMTDIALKNIGNEKKVLDCLKKISGSSQHLLGLINDVLDMSRIESGKTKLNHEKFDLRVCIDNCISIIGGQMATRDMEMVRMIEPFEHPFLIGDELHLRQIFINILGNSVKFTPDGGKLYFRAREKKAENGRALFRFELADTGIGMKEDFLPHIFDAFSQEVGGTRTTYKGTGLGMAITKKFVDLMDGQIEVKSKLNMGTEFQIEVWIDIDSEAKEDELQADFHIDFTGMKVLLVEDIELNMEIAQCILEDEGAVVTPVMNGREAVDAFEKNPEGTFDVIIMDIMMPVMDGITAAKTIRGLDRPDAKTIPILAMTANAYEEDVRKTHEAGMNAHLSKPIDVDMLFKTLADVYFPEKKTPSSKALSGMKVLLADDVDLNLEIAKAMLEEWDVEVTTAENGREAVDLFEKSPKGGFDAILMDVHMPVMDGIAAVKTIRSMERADAVTIPIFAMTADIYEEDIKAVHEAGMNGHLEKPLIAEEIIRNLSAVYKPS